MNSNLIITNLHAETKEGKKILNGISLSVNKGETHAIMGPNGGGKSTFAQVLMGHPDYLVSEGKIILNGIDITAISPDQRAKLGLFLGFQYPVEVAGVNFASFLRMAMNEQRESRSKEKKISPIGIRNELETYEKTLGFNEQLSKRSLNEGFSGGEKKKAEIMQLALLKPEFAILDEPDSGLDVDALRYIGNTITKLEYPLGLILITHYQRILSYIKPDFVHIMIKGKIVLSGDEKLSKKIEVEGYEQYFNI